MTKDDADLSLSFWEERDALFRLAMKFLRNRQEAEDVVHDGYLRAVRHTDTAVAVTLRRAWLFKVVRNLCIDRLRASRRRSDASYHHDIAATLHAEGSQTMTPERELLHSDRLRRAQDAMQKLPPEDAQTLTLAVVEGLSYEEIAYVTDVRIGTVRSRMNRARRMLRGLVDGDPATPQAKSRSRGQPT